MKTTRQILIALIALFLIGCGSVFAQNDPRQDVQKLERAWLDAYEQHDAKAMDAIVADDFTITFANGGMQTKPQIIASLKSPRPEGRSRLDQMSALSLVQGVKRGGGKDTPKERQHKEVTILDVFGNTASVKAVMSDWIDYMHMAKVNGRWVIVNVLWELKPQKK